MISVTNKSTKISDLPAWAQVDLKAIKHNFKEIRRLASRNEFLLPTRTAKLGDPVQVLAVIKADAYGHGIKEVGLLLDRLGCGYLAVSDLAEGMILRRAGIKKPILLFESTLPSQARAMVEHRLIPTICTLKMAQALNRAAKKHRRIVDVHVEIDTGMGRLGVWHEDAMDFIKEVFRLDRIRVHGIYTHFPSADTDQRFTREQIRQLYDLVVKLDKKGMVIPYIHAANSMGLAGYHTKVLNLVRPGLMIYGLYPDLKLRDAVDLRPVLSVRSKVIFIKEVGPGRSISYGRTFIAKKRMTVATIPIGYQDGYLRDFSNKAAVLVSGVRCPVIGRVTMDQTVIDVSNVKNIKLGDTVTVLGGQKGEKITAEELAGCAGTINYEIVCGLGNRLPRLYK